MFVVFTSASLNRCLMRTHVVLSTLITPRRRALPSARVTSRQWSIGNTWWAVWEAHWAPNGLPSVLLSAARRQLPASPHTTSPSSLHIRPDKSSGPTSSATFLLHVLPLFARCKLNQQSRFVDFIQYIFDLPVYLFKFVEILLLLPRFGGVLRCVHVS